MSSPTSTLEKGHMARRFPFPQLLLLLLLLPGSWALSKAQELRRVAGQTLSVRCQYPPRGGPYQSKGWCKEVSKFTCLRLVTSSRPRTLTQISQSSIWDDPAAGFFIVTMTGLKEQDSGHYWCRIYHTSGNSVDRSLRFYLAVSPAPKTSPEMPSPQPPLRAPSTASASMQATWAPHDLVSSQTQSCVSPTGRAGETPGASSAITAPSRQQNPTSHSSPAAPSALVPLLCGLLVAKSLVLSALFVWTSHLRTLRNQHVRHRGRSLTCPARRRPGPWALPAEPRDPRRTASLPGVLRSSSLTSELCLSCEEKTKASQNLSQRPWLPSSLQC
ncbi:natural cytotoxicity triggering receptor 2 isoform X3 [Equus asinus]|uniref:Natural cytotoxicity triggering receptor 2 n=1 Tax=Equus asinus TaxID=9793 RepID=A0A9L0JIE5_EQUAS|nr:natural cytotoxicity triggering receptor 2 isoform X1 [Equus asinus]XP_044632583.1 natural cytotoxicity triggering receptor 2 isoform X1 [Equus asinus]